MKQKIKYFEQWLDNLHPPEVWGCYYGEHRHKTHSRTTVGRWFFVAGYGTPTHRKTEFYQLINPVMRGEGLLDLPLSRWNKYTKWFYLSPPKPRKWRWRGYEKDGDGGLVPYQLYGIPVPKTKGDHLKMVVRPAKNKWVRWAMKVP